jgi:hypothetical protein
MGKFIDADRAQIADIGGGEYALSRDIGWWVGDPSTGWLITIPMGFISDLGSIPWWCRWLFKPRDEAARRAYLLHDYILSLEGWKNSTFSSQLAASQLYDAMVQEGVPLWSRKTQFLGVVLGIAKAEW